MAKNPPAPTSNDLALDRTRLAMDRTLMAWVRTATSLISFGFTIYKFFQYLHQGEPVPERWLGPRGFALTMISIGLAALALATVEHRRHRRALLAQYGTVPLSLSGVVALLVALLGILGLILVLLRQ
jgi:putative membrane protein